MTAAGGPPSQAESEAPSDDPAMDVPTVARGPARAFIAGAGGGRGPRDHGADSPQGLPHTTSASSGSSCSCTSPSRSTKSGSSSRGRSCSRKGPERGIKWRGGAPLNPPLWKYDKDDLRAFQKWKRKISIRELQIQPFMQRKEAALLLYNSLTGDVESELEHVPIESVYANDGIDFIVRSLEKPMAQKAVYQKRSYLADYEAFGQYPAESLRSFANRYQRVERNLEAMGVVTAMCDAESRGGNRLLERAKLELVLGTPCRSTISSTA